ncbi:hypothetical protein PVAND_009398 [Polypedilum vanderplanki]|uniref:Uncharacterized protein n=1 Tax=Polypedilum vanderplanki TaxID=319348 RepID=A0A9J6CD58_POLVA|nr:hypothetical protein PVAND_009398 [Polypedilum vanderplanki]
MTREPERKGQIAGDYGPKGDNGRRGAGRVLVQEKRGNVYYVDHTPDHDYANMKKSLPSLLDDPLGNHLRADQINAFSVLNEDDEDEDYKKKN